MIRKIRITNFRSILEVNLEIPKFGGIFGKNASGKSNFISAIDLCKRLASNDDIGNYSLKLAPFLKEFFYRENINEPCTIQIYIETPNRKQFKFEFSIAYSKTQNTLFSISNEKLISVVNGSENLIYFRNKGTLVDNSGNEIAFKVLPSRLAIATYPDDEVVEAAQSLSNMTIVNKVETSPFGYHVISSDNLEQTLDDLAVALYIKDKQLFNQAVRVTNQIIPNFEGPQIQDINRIFEDAPDSNKKVPKYLVQWNEPKLHNFTYLSLSSGNLSTIYLIFSIFNASEKSLLIIEEIENGLHSDRIRRLIDQIRTQANNRKIQVLFTTHNTTVLDMLKLDEVIYCHRNGEGSKLELVTDTKEYEAIRNDMDRIKNTSDIFASGLFEA